jgi:hypothetical protein
MLLEQPRDNLGWGSELVQSVFAARVDGRCMEPFPPTPDINSGPDNVHQEDSLRA